MSHQHSDACQAPCFESASRDSIVVMSMLLFLLVMVNIVSFDMGMKSYPPSIRLETDNLSPFKVFMLKRFYGYKEIESKIYYFFEPWESPNDHPTSGIEKFLERER